MKRIQDNLCGRVWCLFLPVLIFLAGCRSSQPVQPEPEPFRPAVRGKPGRLTSEERNFFYQVENDRIRYFRDRYRKSLEGEKMWDKSSPYLNEIAVIFDSYGLPRPLCLLPMIESSFDPKARSERAAGMWQFVAPTAREMGLRVDDQVDERLDWRRSTDAAARYLIQLHRLFDDWALALAAYNAGPGTIQRAMEEQKTRDYWKLMLREETMNYVPKYLALLREVKSIGDSGS